MTTPGTALALVQEVYRRYGQGDLDFVFSMLADDVRWCSSGSPDTIPTAAERRGRDGVRKYFEALRADWTVERHDPQAFFSHDDRVAVHTHVVARHNRTGQRLEFDKVDLVTVRNGRIQEFQEIFDSAPLERCMGR